MRKYKHYARRHYTCYRCLGENVASHGIECALYTADAAPTPIELRLAEREAFELARWMNLQRDLSH